jgi:hypothetical protein
MLSPYAHTSCSALKPDGYGTGFGVVLVATQGEGKPMLGNSDRS